MATAVRVYFAHNFVESNLPWTLENDADEELRRFADELGASGIDLVDPAQTRIPPEKFEARFRFCLATIESSSAVLIDARQKLSFGVGAEAMFARHKGIPLFIICPPNSHYRKQHDQGAEWIHPFINGLATRLCSSFESCLNELVQLRRDSK